MIRFGWISEADTSRDGLSALLTFFAQPTVNAWRYAYSQVEELAIFRTSSTFKSHPAAVAAWLRQGEIEANKVQSAKWDPSKLRALLQELRQLTRVKEPSRFLPKLQALCAQAGVAVAIVRTPQGCRASGATRFIAQEKAMLLLSFRYLSDDQFWFTVFHEIGHLLLHDKSRLFVEGLDGQPQDQEREANDFATKALVPDEFRAELMQLGANHERVLRFASKIGLAPGVVVGQLQHYGVIPQTHLNKLKRRYRWPD
jgi:hypothetical protein